MKPIDPARVAALVTKVTQTMMGLTFTAAPTSKGAENGGLFWRTAVLPIPGAQPLTVALSSSQQGCTSLAARLFSCPEGDVDLSMIDDALGELANITAGEIKRALGIDQALCLPVLRGETDFLRGFDTALWTGFPMGGQEFSLVLSFSSDPKILQEFVAT